MAQRLKAFLIHYLTNVAVWLTQGINTVLLGGYADESTSSRAWRLSEDYRFWRFMRWLLDLVWLRLFGEPDHCWRAYMAETLGLQLPVTLRRPE